MPSTHASTMLRLGLVAVLSALGLALTAAAAGAAPATAIAAEDLPAPTNTAPLVGAPDPGGFTLPMLVNVRTGRHDNYDRTVFDFTGGTPGYRIEYGPLVAGGTGTPIAIAGLVTLRVTFHQAFAHDLNTGTPTYDITRVLDPNLPTLRQIKFGEDFEGVVTSGLGLNSTAGFRVIRLHNPDRIAVDVGHVSC